MSQENVEIVKQEIDAFNFDARRACHAIGARCGLDRCKRERLSAMEACPGGVRLSVIARHSRIARRPLSPHNLGVARTHMGIQGI